MSKKNSPMDEEQKKLAAEEEAKAQVAPKEEDVRESIITEYGFDEEADADTIDKLVSKEMDHSKKLSSAIGQKIKAREKALDLEKKFVGEKAPESKKEEVKTDAPDVDKMLDEKLAKRELDNLDYSDELKDEINKIVQVQGITIKQALADPYIIFKVEEYNKEQEVDEASISRKNNKRGETTATLDSPPDVDMSTEEGRKEWDDYKKAMAAAGN